MNSTISSLAEFVQDSRRIVFLGVGSPLKSDDSAGLYIVSSIERGLKPNQKQKMRFYLGELAPENFSGAIRNFNPSHLVIFDAAELGQVPGYFTSINMEAVGGVSFSTHILPLKILVDYLVMTIGCKVMIVGVQPKSLEFAEPMSIEVKTAADQFVNRFLSIL